MNFKRLSFVPFVGLFVWWLVGEFSSPTETAKSNVWRAPQSEAVQALPESVKSLQASDQEQLKPALASPVVMAHPFEFERELATYTELKGKVFLNDEEKEVRRTLLNHSAFMRALGKRLTEAANSQTLQYDQDAAVDLLIEALEDGDSQLASEILQQVVEDGQVEDSSLEGSIREQLAGVKAEILYQWSSAQPEMASSVQAWLPGPVSQKIWRNVSAFQSSNLAESEAEKSR